MANPTSNPPSPRLNSTRETAITPAITPAKTSAVTEVSGLVVFNTTPPPPLPPRRIRTPLPPAITRIDRSAEIFRSIKEVKATMGKYNADPLEKYNEVRKNVNTRSTLAPATPSLPPKPRRDLVKLGLAIQTLPEYTPKDFEVQLPAPLVGEEAVKPDWKEVNEFKFKDTDFKLAIVHANLITCDAEVIVNAANTHLGGGGGIDGAIHKAFGNAYANAHKELKHDYNSAFTVGYAAIIPDMAHISGNATLKKDVIVVAAPSRGSTPSTPIAADNARLYACYRNALELADQKKKTSIAFPGLGIGIFSYPKAEAAKVALKAIEDFITAHPNTSLKKISIYMYNPRFPDKTDDLENWGYYKDVIGRLPSTFSLSA